MQASLATRPRLPSLLLASLIALGAAGTIPSAVSAQPAAGTPQEEAGQAFDRGVKFFKEGDYVAAMVEFKRAYGLDPNYVPLYNIGQTARELKQYSEALGALERYLEEGGAQISEEQRALVSGWVADLRQKVATVTLATNVEGADVAVDDVSVGKTPLAKAVVMDAGRRKITATKEGYAPLTRYVEVAGTEVKTIDLDLVSLTAGPGTGGSTGPAPRPVVKTEIEHTAWPWVGLGVTGAFGIATGIVGGFALSKKSDFDTALTTYPTTQTAIDDARSDARTFAITADVLGGITAGVGVLTVIAFIADYGRTEPEQTEPVAKAKAASIEPIVSPLFVGARGTF